MKLAESLNRTIKLAMDEGRADSYEQAQALFKSFKLRIVVGVGFTSSPAAEAAVLTILNAAPRTFLGGVELIGPMEEVCTRAWFCGMRLKEVAQQFGVATNVIEPGEIPTICIGADHPASGDFSLGLSLGDRQFCLSPDRANMGGNDSLVETGVAAAGAALNEAFQWLYAQHPLAGQRAVRWTLPSNGGAESPESVWVIGLGHLGQAYLWAMALDAKEGRPRHVKLTDFDAVSESNLSTCWLVSKADIGRSKVAAVADRLERLGIQVTLDCSRLNLDAITVSATVLVVVAVDNVALRRSLDRLQATKLLEAGIGDSVQGYTRTQIHQFPGKRKARDIWAEDDRRASIPVDISKPAYQSLLAKSLDICGTMLIAGRSVATPFMGAFAGAILHNLSSDNSNSAHEWNFDLRCL